MRRLALALGFTTLATQTRESRAVSSQSPTLKQTCTAAAPAERTASRGDRIERQGA